MLCHNSHENLINYQYTVHRPNLNKHSESIAKAIQVPNRSHQIQTCNL
jgi:hypothetical protein